MTELKLKINLTAGRPFSIVEADWPEIAEADGFAGEHECQASEVWRLCVRQHADGRAIVYGDRDRGNGGMPISYHGSTGGVLLSAAADIAAAITDVAAGIGIPDSCACECIAALPAEEI